jgi:hypothetical protein
MIIPHRAQAAFPYEIFGGPSLDPLPPQPANNATEPNKSVLRRIIGYPPV